MDFYAVLDQVLALLRQRGRVSYLALKRQFQLDDEALAEDVGGGRGGGCGHAGSPHGTWGRPRPVRAGRDEGGAGSASNA